MASRSTLCAGAALVVFLCAPVHAASAQGYLFGRASFPIGSTGAGYASVAVGDFNGAGMVDLAVVQPSLDSVAILLGKADGTLSPAVYYPTGAQPVAVVVGDFNGDGRQDLAIANQNNASSPGSGANGSVSILLGNGDGTFQPQAVMASGTQPSALALGDLNGDGKLDLVIANQTNSVTVYLGNGDGTFRELTTYSTPGAATSIALGDFNRDGLLDMAVGDSSGAVSIFLGYGDGTFQRAGDLLTLAGVNALVVGDFNHDGAPDVAVTYAQENAVSILLGNGDGAFEPRADFLTGYYPTGLAAGDFNGDGILDLVVTNGNDETFSVFLGNGDGTLQTAQTFVLPAGPTALAVHDFNRDGKSDLAIVLSGNGTVTLIPGRGDGTFPSPQAYGGYQGAWAIVAGDFTGDGNLDLVTTNLLENSISVFTGAGDGTFASGAMASTGLVPSAAAAADFNRDGRLDLAVVNQTCTSLPCANGSVSVYLGNGDGTFQPAVDYTAGNIPVAVTVADLNGDGIPDLAVTNNGFGYSNSVSLFWGQGNGTFRSGGALATGTGPTQAVAADFNGDGVMDLAVAFDAGVAILLGRGAGAFGPPTDYPIPDGGIAIATGDFNQDGKVDLAVTNLDSLIVLLGNGDGTFQPGVSYPLESVIGPTAILVGDFNGDGKPDLLVGKSSNAVSILMGNGDGTFQPPVDVAVGKSERGWVAGNFDGAGGLDLAVASVSETGVFVALNPPVVGFYPGGLNFVGQAVGLSSAPAAITVSNPSGAPLAISGVTVSGPFIVTSECPATLAPGASCALNISFLPTSAGSANGVLTLSDNAIGNPHSVSLAGTGVAVAVPVANLSTSALAFGNQRVGTSSSPRAVTLRNSGNAPLQIHSVRATGDFAVTSNCPGSLSARASCTISIRFDPTAAGMLAGAVTIADNALSSPQSVVLSGTGIVPLLSVNPSQVSFPAQRMRTASPRHSLTLSNPGSAPLAISSIKITGEQAVDFTLQGHCGDLLAPGQSCTVFASFTPRTVGSRGANLKIVSDAAGSPPKVTLNGTGTALLGRN